jgi:hypothetical protein
MTDAERIRALQGLGYDEREARFLAVAALHGGYFLRRQFESFAQLKRGRVSGEFLRKTVKAGHARVNVYANRTEVYHLFARPFYRAIAEEENRNRRSRPPLSIKAKLMALDYVLGHRSHHYLATEQEKVDYFVLTLGIDSSKLPAKTYPSGARELGTRRYFVEKYPLFLSTSPLSASPVVSLCYVDEGVLSTTGFESFLNRYRRLFTALRRFRLIYVAAEQLHLRSAERKFLHFCEELSFPERCRLGGILGDYFWLRYLLDTSQWALLDTAGLNRLGDLTRRFRSSPMDQRFEDWKEELAAAQGSGPVGADFETVRLPYHYDIFGTTGTATKPSNQEHRIAGGAPAEPSAPDSTMEAKPLRFQQLNPRRQAGRAVKGVQAGRERPRFLGGCSAQKPLSAAGTAPRVAPVQPAFNGD